MLTFHLYFDESGNFEEHTLLEDESIRRTAEPQTGASQLVGILVPESCASATVEQLLSLCHEKVGLPLGYQFHATNLRMEGRGGEYALLLDELFNQLETNKIQPVRLCNNDRLGFGCKIATYTSMVAEMVVRIFEELTRVYGGIPIDLKITAARVRTNGLELDAPPLFIDRDEYKRRLDEQIAFAAVRRGVAHNRINWRITGFRFGSGLNDRPLQLCDLLSNASYRGFRNCSSDQKQRLKLLFGRYDSPFNRSDLLEEIEQQRRDGSLAHAVQTIAENWNRSELDQNVRRKIREQCSSLVTLLADMPAATRNLHLRQLTDWGSQFLAIRNLEMATRIFLWLEEQIADPLCAAVEDPARDDLLWFPAQLLLLRLGQYNHRGDLKAARPLSDRLQQLFPLLAGRWEHAALLTEAMTLRAVHLNDCFEFDEASRVMGAVEGFYGALSSLMADAMPGLFPERVRSLQRGMALGTRLQSELFAGLSDPSRLDDARQLNEMALDEFISESDRQRQYQYRCQIEAFSGNFADARWWLARSLGTAADGHENLAERIREMDGVAQGFALLHWTRIGMEAGRRGVQGELNVFLDAFMGNRLNFSPWVNQQAQEYPAHGIRRHLAVSLVTAGRYAECTVMSGRLASLTAGTIALTLIPLAGLLEVAARWPADQTDMLRKMIHSPWGKKKKSLLQETRAFAGSTAEFPRLHDVAENLLDGITGYEASGFSDAHLLLLACKKVGQ